MWPVAATRARRSTYAYVPPSATYACPRPAVCRPPTVLRAYANIGLLWFCPSRYKYQTSISVSRRAYPNKPGMAYATGILPRALVLYFGPQESIRIEHLYCTDFGASNRFGRLLQPWGLTNYATYSCQINYFSYKDGLCMHARDGRTHA